MELLYAKIVGNKRLLLNHINEIEYTPDSPFQLILGRNGSGKSSLLKELSPLPSHKSSYIKGGYSIKKWKNRGKEYVLTSDFKSGSKHSFVVEGEEFNPGGTGKVQKELVERHFGITQDIHNLLTGKLKFTDMSPQQRREWITRLSDSDLTYAIGVYNKLKSRHRDDTGALKHITGRLLTETNKLLSLVDIDVVSERSEELGDKINQLMEHRRVNDVPTDDAWRHIDSNIEAIKDISMDIMFLHVSPPPGVKASSLEELDGMVRKEEEELISLQKTLDVLTDQFHNAENMVQTMSNANVASVDEIQRKLEGITADINCITETPSVFGDIVNSERLLETNDFVLGKLTQILTSLPDNTDGYMSRSRFHYNKEELEKLAKEIGGLEARLERAGSRIEHIKQSKESTCPKCKYIWIEGVSENELEDLKQRSINYRTSIDELVGKKKEIESYQEEYSDYVAIVNNFKSLANDNPSHQALWDYVISESLLFNNPAKNLGVVDQWRRSVDVAHRVLLLEREHDLTQKAWDAAKAMEGTGACHVREHRDRLSAEIDEVTEKILHQKSSVIGPIKYYQSSLTELTGKYHTLEKMMHRLDLQMEAVAGFTVNDMVSESLRENQTELGLLQATLNEKRTLEGIIRDLERDKEELEKNIKASGQLIKEMSPVDGLIAEQLFGFIGMFVDQMNEVIENIWTYEMVISPCGGESGELDYVFPMTIRLTNNVEDVSEGSDGQKEMIDFAFKLIVMTHLELEGSPLYADELGHFFDEQHRVNLVQYLKFLVDTRRVGQLLMVSHYATEHGSLSQADVCVLDPANVTVKTSYNKHVIIR